MAESGWFAGLAGRSRPAAAPLIAGLLWLCLSGCFGGDESSRSSLSPGDLPGADQAHLNHKGEVISPAIDALQLRQTILPQGSSFAGIAGAVLERSRASAEAELRVKRLTAKARSKNWLPKLGPDVNLTSLSSIAASLVMDQAIFDRGRRQAERDFAAADVEVAAITLVGDLNQKVYDGLKLYIEAQRARELAMISSAALTRMAEFERVTKIRVEGGLSDGSEYRLVSQRRAEIDASLASYREGEISAWAGLETLTGRPMQGLAGLTPLPPDAGQPDPLSVMMAEAEAARTLAEVDAARSGLLPGLAAGGRMSKQGTLSGGVSLEGDILGFGRGDEMRALEESIEVAGRKVGEARDEASRRIVALSREIATLAARESVDGAVIAETEANMGLYTEQYKAGRRSLIDLTGQFDALTRMKRDHASLKYQIAVARLEIALLRGVLVEGAAM